MRNTKYGFTLLEILIALVLFTSGVVIITGLFSTGILGSVDAENTTIAMNLAQAKMEEIRNLDFDTEIIDEDRVAVTGFPTFEREVTVSEPETDLKLVRITVYWTLKGGVVDVPLTTYISKN